MEKKGLRVAEPRVLRLDQWGSEKGAEIREILTLRRVYDSEWVQCETGWRRIWKARLMSYRLR